MADDLLNLAVAARRVLSWWDRAEDIPESEPHDKAEFDRRIQALRVAVEAAGHLAAIPHRGTTAEQDIARFLRERVGHGDSWERATSRMLDEFFRPNRTCEVCGTPVRFAGQSRCPIHIASTAPAG